MEQLLEFFKPKRYQLELFIDKENDLVDGDVVITGAAKADKIFLHAVDMKIKSVKINDAKTDFTHDGEVITLNAPVSDNIKIEVKFQNKLNKNMEGIYLSTYKYGKKIEKIVSTQFESHYAREAFPCVDEPAAKAVFELTIKLPEGSDDIVLSNNIVAKKDGTTTIFEPTPRMSTYLLAFVIGKFHAKSLKNAHGTLITTYAPLNQSPDSVDFANEVAARSLEFYDNEFGVPYPLEKLDQVAIPDFDAGAMENWGLVTYRESMLLADKTATFGTKKSIALTVAHELSHQWFGDLVTMRWWDDLWLNESFASIMEYMAVDAIYPEFKIWQGFFTGDCLSALYRDAYFDVQSVHQDVSSPAEIATLFDGAIVYSKGARLMLMLIRAMGWENFKKGIYDYFKRYAYQNTIGDNLWEALAPYADFNPKEFMHAWIDQPGYPVLTDGEQQRFLLDGEMKPSNWPIPQVLDDMSGHYVLNLSEKEFTEKLADFDKLSLEQKLRLLIDRSLLARTPLCASAPLIDLIAKFKNEDSAAIWKIIISIISNLKVFFDPDSDEEKMFKKYVLDLISDKLKEVGLKTRKDDDENMVRLRDDLLALDLYAEDRANLTKLAKFYNDDLTALDIETRSDILDAKLYVEPAMLGDYLKKYQATADPEIKYDLLYATTLTKDEKNIDKLVSLLGEPEIVKPQDHLHLYLYLFRNSKARAKAFEWLKANWKYVEEMSGDKTIDSYPRYMAGVIRTSAEVEAFFEFFDQFKDQPVMARTLKIAHKEIDARLALITSDQKDVVEKLKSCA